MKKHSLSSWLLFIIPSLLGVFIFMTPLNIEGAWKVPIAIMANSLAGVIVPVISWFALTIMTIAAVGSVIYLFLPKTTMKAPSFAAQLFRVNLFWTITRVLAVVFTAMAKPSMKCMAD